MHGVKRGKTRRLHQTVTYRYNVITQKISALMCIKTTVLVRMVLGHARTAEAIHGFWTMKMMPLARETATGNIAAIAAKASAKPSMQADTTIAMARGNSIRPVSTGAQALAETAARRTMIMPATV